MNESKQYVHDFWNEASCGERLYLTDMDKSGYQAHSEMRYKLEPYILEFANFREMVGKKVLEIGVGLGADHQKFAEVGANLYGIDLTERAVNHTRQRLEIFSLSSNLKVMDAENLDFPDESFDCVYSWGVLHHSPDTKKAISEVWRVLRRGGIAKIMVYNKWSMVGFMLWVRYGLFRFRPWISMQTIYSRYLESPGTKAYSKNGAHEIFSQFSNVKIHTVLTHGDLLESDAGQRHRGIFLYLARKIWPRMLIRKLFPNAGLFMLIEGRK